MANKKTVSRRSRSLSLKRFKKGIKTIKSKKYKRMSLNGGFKSVRQRKEIMPTVSLGLIPSSYQSNIKDVSEKELDNFINNSINYGPQIVSLPVPPQRHAFLVDVQNNKIMISDWGGPENKIRGVIKINNKRNPIYLSRWKQYSDFMAKLEAKYNLPIEYYPTDEELTKKSDIINSTCNGGGCSHYIYDWIKLYYPNYS